MSISTRNTWKYLWDQANYQLREGAWVVIARSDSKLCPVAMLEQYQFVMGAGQITVQRSGDHKEGL